MHWRNHVLKDLTDQEILTQGIGISVNMVDLLDLPVEIMQAILACLPADSLLDLFPTCRWLNYLSTSALLEHHGIRDPTNCTFDLDNKTTGPPLKADALSALLAGLHIKQMKFLRCNLKTSPYWGRRRGRPFAWPASQPLRRLHRLIQRLTSIDDVELSFNMKNERQISLDDAFLKSGIDILQNLLNMIITKSCKTLHIINLGSFFGERYIFNQPDSITQRSDRHNDSPDWQYKRDDSKGTRLFLTCSPAALQNVALTRMQIDAMSLFTPPCSNWTFAMLKQSRIKTLMLSLTWPKLGYTPAERSLILSRLVVAIQASVTSLCILGVTHILEALGFIAQLPLVDALNFIPWTWKAELSDEVTTAPFPIVLNMKTICAPAEMLSFMFSRPLTIPRLRRVFVAFSINKEGMFDITTTATSIARLRDSVGPNIGLFPMVRVVSVPPLMESLCNGIRPICPIWEQEFSKFTTLGLWGQMTLLDGPNTFRIILGLLTLFPGIDQLKIQLGPSPKVNPTPIHLKPWMVTAILNRSPNITSIFFNGVAQNENKAPTTARC